MSYQPNTFTRFPSAIVSWESNVQLAGDPKMSELTMGSSVYSRTLASLPLVAAALNASFTSSGVTSRARIPVKSVMEPSWTGTRREDPSRRPFMLVRTRLVARAAPVLVGTMLLAAARDRRWSLCTRSSRFWSLV